MMTGKTGSSSVGEEDTASSIASSGQSKRTASTKSTIGPRDKPAHPSTADMVVEAIAKLGERGGSSLFAIKKYIGAVYKLDTEKLAHYIKKFLKNAVASGALIQPKGKGASGSFKLPSARAIAEKKKHAKSAAEANSSKIALAKTATKKTSKNFESAKKTLDNKLQTASSAKIRKTDSSSKGSTIIAAAKSPKGKKIIRSPARPKTSKVKRVAGNAKSTRAMASGKTTIAAK